jgi:hypothetical protein
MKLEEAQEDTMFNIPAVFVLGSTYTLLSELAAVIDLVVYVGADGRMGTDDPGKMSMSPFVVILPAMWIIIGVGLWARRIYQQRTMRVARTDRSRDLPIMEYRRVPDTPSDKEPEPHNDAGSVAASTAVLQPGAVSRDSDAKIRIHNEVTAGARGQSVCAALYLHRAYRHIWLVCVCQSCAICLDDFTEGAPIMVSTPSYCGDCPVMTTISEYLRLGAGMTGVAMLAWIPQRVHRTMVCFCLSRACEVSIACYRVVVP